MPAGTGEAMNEGLLALFFDLGDTIMDEGTEVKDAELTTLRADLIPGLGDALRWCKRRVGRLALVADTRPGTAANVLAQHGLADLFDYLAISEIVGVEKPDPRIFAIALEGTPPSEALHLGDTFTTDVVGARNAGMRHAFIDVHDAYAGMHADVPRVTSVVEVCEAILRERG